MKVNQINNNQASFGALVKTSTSQDTINERMLIQEIKKCSQNCDRWGGSLCYDSNEKNRTCHGENLLI